MNALGYVRVSGRGQVDKDGPDRQADAIEKFCQQQGFTYLGRFFEPGVSGTVEAMDRPEFSKLIDRIERDDAAWLATRRAKDEADGIAGRATCRIDWGGKQREAARPCIVVERLDRLARDLMVQEFLLQECRKRGIKVFCVDQGPIDVASDDVDPTRKLIRQVLGALAEWEKSALVLKLRKSRDRIREATGHCEGPLPYGTTPAEKKTVEFMQLCRAKGYSLDMIAGELNNSGMRSRQGLAWTRGLVHNVLRKNK